MPLRAEEELGKLAVASGAFDETRLAALLERSGKPLLGERLVTESLIDEGSLEGLIEQLTGQQRYTATFFFGRHLVAAGHIEREQLKGAMAGIKAALKAGEESPTALLAALVDADTLDAGLLEELAPQLDAFVHEYEQCAAYGSEKRPGLAAEVQKLRSAYQRQMIDEKGLYGVLRARLSNPGASSEQLLGKAGVGEEQLTLLSASRHPTRRQTKRAARPRRQTGRKEQPSRREASSRRERPTQQKPQPKKGVNARVGVAISLLSVSAIIGVGIWMGSGKRAEKGAGSRIDLGKAGAPETKQPSRTARQAPARPPAGRALSPALRRARERALATIALGKLSRSMDALERYQDAMEKARGGTDWEAELKKLAAMVHQQGQAVFTPRKAEVTRLIAARQFKQAGAALQRLWDALPQSFADELAALAKQLQQAIDAASPEPKPKPGPKDTSPPAKADTMIKMVERGIALMEQKQWVAALQFLSPVSRAQQGNFECHFLKARCLNELGNTQEALRWATSAAQQAAFFAKNGGKVTKRRRSEMQLLLGQIYQQAGEGVRAAEAFARSHALYPLQGPARLARPDALWMAGRFAEALKSYEAMVEQTGRLVSWPHLGRGTCLMKLGRYEQAGQAFAEAAACRDAQGVMKQIIGAHQAWLQLEAAGKKPGYTVARCREMMTRLSPLKSGYAVAVYGMLLVREHLYHSADEYFRNTDRSVVLAIPEVPFHHGLALLRLGRPRAARVRLVDAIRRRPGLLSALQAQPEAATIVPAVKTDLADLAGVDLPTRLRRAADHRALRRDMIAADDLVRANRFAEAAAAYRSFAAWAEAPSVRAAAEHGAARADGLAALLGRYRERHAADKTAWPRLSFEQLVEKLEPIGLTPRDRYQLGALAWMLGIDQQAHALLIAAREDPASRTAVDRFLAEARWITPPARGFVAHGGRLVTPAEQAALKAGKRPFLGAWVDAATLKRLLKGERRIDGQWVQLTDDRLRFQELAPLKGQWLPMAEYRGVTGGFAGGATLQTGHFTIRSDRGRPFIAKLGLLLEQVHGKLKGMFNKAPPAGKKLRVLAFSTQRDYLAYLARFDTPAHLAAAARGGMTRSEPLTCAVYDRTGGLTDFLQACVGQTVELYYLEATGKRPPSWAIEGFKTHFRGFTTLDEQVAWNRFIERPMRVVRRALVRKGLIPLERLATADLATISAPRERAVFEAQAWALFHFFGNTVDKQLQEKFVGWFSSRTQGGQQSLEQALGQTDWARVMDGFSQFLADL